MRALLCSSKLPVLRPNPSPAKPSSNRLLLPSSPILVRPPAVRFRANAKGFSGQSDTSTAKVGGDGGGGDGRKGEDDDEEEIPQVVFERMMVRIVSFVGVPMAAGIGLLSAIGAVKERGMWDVPLWVPFTTTLLCFGASALGIAYGTLSSSWDPDRTGSVLGFEEAQKNWVEMWSDEGDD